MPARLRPRPTEIREVFLGATVRDLDSYRFSVCEAIRKVRASIFLQEDWAESAADVVALSIRRLKQSDAYIGLFGYRYGSVPDGHDKSVTEIEFDYVMQHWQGEPFPPLFIFLPKADSPAAEELQRLADEVLEAECPNQDERAENKRKQKAFRDHVQGLWRFCRDFSTLGDLREWVIAAIDHYQLQILRNALEARDAAFRAEFSPANLGTLDRDPQLRALRRALQGLSRSEAPGMCIVIHGAEPYGQTEFLANLKAWPGWESSAGGRMITPPYDAFAVSSIVTAALSELTSDASVTAGSSEAGVEDLARCIVHICKDEPLALFLFGINRLNGGPEALQEAFWEPLYAALRRMRDPRVVPHHVSLVVAHGDPLPAPLPSFVWNGAIDAPNYRMLLPLPELGEFAPEDVERWLEKRGIEGGKLAAIIDRVTQPDCVPAHIFERLRSEQFQGVLG